ncbi:glycosyltransferase [Nocardiopsis kunsanensis]|uniref:4,4'-diaponeurosporenoate glycosyltransferase n=1 Tax=Nocardiopsis kunsanensis TaxID=141693 RepID=A0A919CGX7_9ACTN|nr:glycosyltransferase [Nocardiopsis kunsanensis]GHD24394.1 glycosyl transferase [Nocardiopsis kunsanensis]
MIRTVAVVVPAHDESACVAACLSAVHRALEHAPVPPEHRHVVVVADGCRDGTASAARLLGAHVVEVPHCGVGAARDVGVRRALALAGGVPADSVWLASTDADTLVPVRWIADQLVHAKAGHDAVAGTVEVTDWSLRSEGLAERFGLRFPVADGHDHVHGANLGVRASAYVDAGGFPDLGSGEDHALVERLTGLGLSVRSPGDLPVRTSARRSFRAPEGFGRLLDTLERGVV